MHHLAEQIETGQESRPKTVSLQEKKTFYREVFDDMNEILTAFKNRLETMRSSDKRIAELLERIEKCEKELCRICDIMGRF
jgi:predicted site-specific integrase-resolvase